MKNWQTTKLKEVCEKVTVGFVGSMAHEYRENGIPFLRSQNITPYRVNFDNLKYIDDKFHEKIRKSALRPGDVAVVRTGYPGTACVIPRNLSISNCSDLVIIRPGRQLNPHFLCAIFNSTFGRDLVGGNLVGAAQQHFNITVAKELKLQLPPRHIQDKISAILSAYDDLIENNKRRIALLEKMAEEIYREWFVRFRFPGHDQVKIVKGVPGGWRVAELKELAAVNPSSISRRVKPETILYVDISSVSTNQIEEVTTYPYSEAPGRARRRVKHGDVIWSSVRPANRAYCLIYEPPENLIVSTGFAVIRPNPATPFSFLFFAVTSNTFVDQMTMVAKGAAYPATSFDDFEKAKLLVPSDALLRSFHEKAEPLFRQKHFLQQQCERLKQTRDLLLPRLISGKLPVEDLDIRFPPSMEEAVCEA